MATDVPGANGDNYNPDKISAFIEGRIGAGVSTDDRGWMDHITPFDVKKMVHFVFFVVSVHSLDNEDVQERYKKLKSYFTSYRHHGIEGYHPFLIITKGDSIAELRNQKEKVWDWNVLHEKKIRFLKAAGFQESQTHFIINYLPGLFERDDIIDFAALNLVNEAVASAKGVIARLCANPVVVPNPLVPGNGISVGTKPLAPSQPVPPLLPVQNDFDEVVQLLNRNSVPKKFHQFFEDLKIEDIADSTVDDLQESGVPDSILKALIADASGDFIFILDVEKHRSHFEGLSLEDIAASTISDWIEQGVVGPGTNQITKINMTKILNRAKKLLSTRK